MAISNHLKIGMQIFLVSFEKPQRNWAKVTVIFNVAVQIDLRQIKV